MKSTVAISRVRILAWTMAVSLAFGTLGIGQPLELLLQTTENGLIKRPASGNIVVVGIDDESIAKHGKFPWPRRDIAEIVTTLDRLGAARIFIDGDVSAKTNPIDDAILREAFARTRHKVTVATQSITDNTSGKTRILGPNPMFRDYVDTANINFRYNFWGMVLNLPLSMQTGDKNVASLSAKMAGRHLDTPRSYPVDFSIDLQSIPQISAANVLTDNVKRHQIYGKTVVIGTNSTSIGDIYMMPRYGQVAGVFFHVLGAETLHSGLPSDLGWFVPLLMAFFLFTAAMLFVSPTRVVVVAAILTTLFLLTPLALHGWMVFVEVVPALTLFALAGGRVAWLNFRNSYRVRGTINAVSGLPNLKALRDVKTTAKDVLIVGRIQNFAEITSTLMPEREKELVDQITKRLTVGSSLPQLYQGDEGLFAWLADAGSTTAMNDHLKALQVLFRRPVVVDSEQIDLVVNFGIDRDPTRSVANRLGSAMVAAEEAAAEGVSWKDYDPAKLKDASWKLSLLSQLDAAIDAGDLWVAYQPKIDLRSGTIVGAEALVRWEHPEKGAIMPDEFIKAAEQGNRIDKLTLFVLDQALSATSEVLATGVEFDIAVNLSARLVEDPTIVTSIIALLDQHRLDPCHLTLEITETAALGQTTTSLGTLNQIRALGMGLSIDDYGTGMSTLDYLRRIPATQIKIDRCFIDAIDRGGGDLVMVNSTIQLAHSLGLKVVGEGVERQRTLDILADLGCDTAQGYFIGRPMPLRSLLQLLAQSRKLDRGRFRLQRS